jgi:hypothetical protein
VTTSGNGVSSPSLTCRRRKYSASRWRVMESRSIIGRQGELAHGHHRADTPVGIRAPDSTLEHLSRNERSPWARLPCKPLKRPWTVGPGLTSTTPRAHGNASGREVEYVRDSMEGRSRIPPPSTRLPHFTYRIEHLHVSNSSPSLDTFTSGFNSLYHSEVCCTPLSHACRPTTKTVARFGAEEARQTLPGYMERDAAHRRDTASSPE